ASAPAISSATTTALPAARAAGPIAENTPAPIIEPRPTTTASRVVSLRARRDGDGVAGPASAMPRDCRRLLPGALLERPVERLEHRGSSLKPRAVLAVLQTDAGDLGGEAGALLAFELPVAQVEVVDHVGDPAQRRVLAAPAGEQDLEGAQVPFVRELGVEHVEAQLARGRDVAPGLDVLELRAPVDEPGNQPGARDPIPVNPLAGHPGSAAHGAQRREIGRRPGIGGLARVQLVVRRAEQPVQFEAAGRAEESARDDLTVALANPRQRRLRLRAPLRRQRALTLVEPVENAAHVLGEPEVVPLSRPTKLLLDRIVGDGADEARFAERGFAAVAGDLVGNPFQILARAVRVRESVDRVLHGDGAQLLQPPADLYPQVRGARGNRVDEENPAGRQGPFGRRRGPGDTFLRATQRVTQRL